MVALAAVLWGLWPVFLGSSGLTGAQSAAVAFAVMALPAPFMFSLAGWRDRRATIALIAVGVFDAGNVLFYFSALERGPVVLAVLTHYLAPMIVALASPWLLNEPLSRRALWASPVILGGLVLVVRPDRRQPLQCRSAHGARAPGRRAHVPRADRRRRRGRRVDEPAARTARCRRRGADAARWNLGRAGEVPVIGQRLWFPGALMRIRSMIRLRRSGSNSSP